MTRAATRAGSPAVAARAEERRPSRFHPGAALIAAAIGWVGPAGAVLGWGPVTVWPRHHAASLATITGVAVAAATAAVLLGRRRGLLALPLLIGAGALATWPTAGRVQGAMCVLATVAAAELGSALRSTRRSPTSALIASSGLIGVVVAGVVWAVAGPGIAAVGLLSVSAVAGSLLARDRRVGAIGDPRLRHLVTSLGRWFADIGRRSEQLTVGSAMAVTGVLGAALTAPIFHRLASEPAASVAGFNDFRAHLDFAEQMQWSPFRLTVPHPLFHLLVVGLRPALGEVWATTFVLSTATALATASLVWIAAAPLGSAPRLSARAAPLFALAFLLTESPSTLLQLVGLLDDESRFAAVHLWASPTETMLLPFVFLLVAKVSELLDDPAPDRRLIATTAALSLGAALAKPALTLALVPALVVLVAVDRSVHPGGRWAVTTAVVVPSVLILGWQTWFLSAGNVPQGTSEFSVKPLATLDVIRIGHGGVAFWSALVIVPLAIRVGGARYRRDRTVQVTGLALVCALMVLLVFHEGGIRGSDGNLAKPAYFSWMLLYTWSLRHVIAFLMTTPVQRSDRRGRIGMALSAATLGALLAGGVTAWLDAVGVIRLPGWQVAA